MTISFDCLPGDGGGDGSRSGRGDGSADGSVDARRYSGLKFAPDRSWGGAMRRSCSLPVGVGGAAGGAGLASGAALDRTSAARQGSPWS